MTLVSETSPTPALDGGDLSLPAREAERLARTDPAAARDRLRALRALVEALPDAVRADADGLVRILDQLDADLATGAVRSITGLARRVRQLEARARRAPAARL